MASTGLVMGTPKDDCSVGRATDVTPGFTPGIAVCKGFVMKLQPGFPPGGKPRTITGMRILVPLVLVITELLAEKAIDAALKQAR